MDIKKLFSGVAVIIDDAIEDLPEQKETNTGDKINNIITILRKNNIPLLKYKDIPDDDEIKNFGNISLIILDWDLNPLSEGDKISGVRMGSINQDKILNFLERIKECSFLPVFIFSRENIHPIKTILKEKKLYFDEKSNYIFVKSKDDLIDEKNPDKLFNEIETWIKETPSVYVLKEWEKHKNEATNKLFWDFYNITPYWPNILWKNYQNDGIDTSSALNELIYTNLQARSLYYKFEEQILSQSMILSENSSKDIRLVLEGERYIKYDSNFKIDEIYTGDIFKIGGKYYLNVRPQCDCIPRDDISIEEIEVYCIKGTKINQRKESDSFNSEFGKYDELINNVLTFPIDKGKTIDFRFNNFKIMNYCAIKDKKIGRLLPPFITQIIQKFVFYLQRQGLSRIPLEAVISTNNTKNMNNDIEKVGLQHCNFS
jgi:hypothetical protein